uniref:Uncharacterized protein n=1 Tax=Setaria viridis TaxID=4556 RepID=A0A4U6T155_SETVI|nr:hypothetical protein SEVIR_9G232466v2 [Setaria viridis]
MGVKRLSTAMFMLHFSTPERRTATLRLGGLYSGQTALHLLPWTRQEILNIQTPPYPEEYYWQMGDVELPTTRCAPADMLEYQVTLHLDRVHDYSPLPSSPSHESVHRGISGLPDDLEEQEWPVKHRFAWQYGVPDNRIPPRRRASVHDRIGGRRDRSPTGGSGGGRGENNAVPPSKSS